MNQYWLTDWRERDGVLVRFNGRRNGWEVKVNGEVLKAAFVNEQAAVRFGLAQSLRAVIKSEKP